MPAGQRFTSLISRNISDNYKIGFRKLTSIDLNIALRYYIYISCVEKFAYQAELSYPQVGRIDH